MKKITEGLSVASAVFIPETGAKGSVLRVEIARIIFGLLLLYRYLDMSSVQPVVDVSTPIFMQQFLLGVITAVGCSAGVFAPLLLLLFPCFLLESLFTISLTDQVVSINCWVLLLAGAGRHMSVDTLLFRVARLQCFMKLVYCFSSESTLQRLAVSRGIGALPFLGNDSYILCPTSSRSTLAIL